MRKKSKNKIIGFYHEIVKEKPVPYVFAKGEKEQYEKICLDLWSCIPNDVAWAKGTLSYQEKSVILVNEITKTQLPGNAPGEPSPCK